MSRDPVLLLDGVGKTFGGHPVLQDISLRVHAGETLALLGPSGSGKTTTLRIIAGFERPDSGAVFIAGQAMGRKKPYERNVGLLFQDYALFPHMTVADNIGYGMRHRGVPKRDIPGRIAAMLDMVKLREFEHRYPAQLSGGQQQRVALARALATMPPLVLLDEPLSALDAKLRQELRLELKDIISRANCTTVVVTHDQEEAMSLGDQIVILDHGRIVQAGDPASLYERPNSRFVAEFLGRANWFRGVFPGRRSGGFAQFACESGHDLHVPPPLTEDGRFDVCVRPERLETWTPDMLTVDAGGQWNRIDGVLIELAYLGPAIHLVAELTSGQRITLIQANKGQRGAAAGQPISLAFRPEDCVVLPAPASGEEPPHARGARPSPACVVLSPV